MGNYDDRFESTGSNLIAHKGMGNWVIHTYNPSAIVGPVEGILDIDQKFHTVSMQSKAGSKILVSVPSQNVAFVYDREYVEKSNVVVAK